MSDATVYHSKVVNVEMGDNVKYITPVNMYGCKLGHDSFVGPFVEIQRNSSIGDRTRVQSHSFICEMVTIGDDCFIAHGVMFINDLFNEGQPEADMSKWRATEIGNNVSIGSNATILPVKICDGTVIGAGSVVVKDINKKGIYAGNPARLIREL